LSKSLRKMKKISLTPLSEYKPKSYEWFKARIGKRIYRDDQGCECDACVRVTKEGIIVTNLHNHAQYLADIDYEYAIEGTFSNYRDEK